MAVKQIFSETVNWWWKCVCVRGFVASQRKQKLYVAFTMGSKILLRQYKHILLSWLSKYIIGLIHKLTVDFSRVVARGITMEKEKLLVFFYQ